MRCEEILNVLCLISFHTPTTDAQRVSRRPTHGKTLTGQFHWTKMDLILIFTTKHFRLSEALRKVFFHFYRRFFLIRLTLGKIRAKASQPGAVDEFFRGRDGSGG